MLKVLLAVALVDVAGIAAAAGQVGFGHREFAAEDVQSVEDRCSRIGRRIGGAGNRLDFCAVRPGHWPWRAD